MRRVGRGGFGVERARSGKPGRANVGCKTSAEKNAAYQSLTRDLRRPIYDGDRSRDRVARQDGEIHRVRRRNQYSRVNHRRFTPGICLPPVRKPPWRVP